MTQRTEKIKQLLTQALEPITLEIVDDSAAHAGHAGVRERGGGHYSVFIVSSKFKDTNTVKRHQLVYKALGSMMQAEIHALSIQALTPDQVEN
ncbi:MAG TPA: BolA family transcriptional regulator [Crenotrichaceae bacterium]|nr:BolA family transcriptional regulator [Crenotrichaceae bacterium]